MPPGDQSLEPPRPPTSATTRRRVRSSYQELGPVQRDRIARSQPSRRRRSGLAVLVAFVVIAAGSATAATVWLHRQSSYVGPPPGPAAYTVIFVVDGARPEYFDAAYMRNVAELARTGVRYGNAWVGQLEASAPASNATIATGVYPMRHGLIGNEWETAAHHQIDTSTDPAQVHLGSLDQLVESHGVTPLAALLRDRYPNGHIVSIGGAGCVEASAAGTWLADSVLCPARSNGRWMPSFVVGHPPDAAASGAALTAPVARGSSLGAQTEGWNLGDQDAWIARYAVREIRAVRPRLLVVNFPEAGVVARWAPPERRPELLQRVMAGIDRDIGTVIGEMRREGTYKNAVYVLTADQAVVPIVNRISRARVDEAIFAAGGQKVYLEADASIMIGLRDPLQTQPVAQAFQSERLPHVDAVFYKTGSGASWNYVAQYLDSSLSVRFAQTVRYLLSTMVSDVSPDVVAVTSPDTGTGDTHLGPFRRTGAGWGLQWGNQHIPLIISGHGVLQGISSTYPARLVDVLPTLAALTGLKIGPSDGVVLGDAMSRPPAGAVGRQRAADGWLTPMVNALEQQAKAATRG